MPDGQCPSSVVPSIRSTTSTKLAAKQDVTLSRNSVVKSVSTRPLPSGAVGLSASPGHQPHHRLWIAAARRFGASIAEVAFAHAVADIQCASRIRR